MSQPAAGSARTAPTAVESRTNPSPPSVIPSRVLRSGICGTQLAKTTPFTKKHSDTAPRARAGEGAGAPRTVIGEMRGDRGSSAGFAGAIFGCSPRTRGAQPAAGLRLAPRPGGRFGRGAEPPSEFPRDHTL